MEWNAFARMMAEVVKVEPETIQTSDRLRAFEAWDSMAALTLIALVDEQYGLTLDADRVAQCVTIGDVAELVGQTQPKT